MPCYIYDTPQKLCFCFCGNLHEFLHVVADVALMYKFILLGKLITPGVVLLEVKE